MASQHHIRTRAARPEFDTSAILGIGSRLADPLACSVPLDVCASHEAQSFSIFTTPLLPSR